MNRTSPLEQSLAALLRYGSWLASAAIGLGFVLALIDSRVGTRNLAILPSMASPQWESCYLFCYLPSAFC
jgi:hypothetical protein